MKTSIIILTYNQLDYTKQCIESIRKYTNKETYELIVVDNASTDGTVNWLKQQNDIKLILNKINNGFPKGCNQGIQVAIGETVLLLNNDTIVTKNWLGNLTAALYSDEKIGAVGPVTNSAAYYTAIPVEYNTLEEMHQFAESFNQSDSSKWEERLKLIGFCMLIKKAVIDEIGELDERFTPGNFEDDDYSIRMRTAGYQLKICKDTFIHHYGSVSFNINRDSYIDILSDNEVKFKEKWGTDASSYIIDQLLINQIYKSRKKELSILHIGCRAGATLLELKNYFENATLYGIEENVAEAEEAKKIGYIYQHIEEIRHEKFDVILYTRDSLLSEKALQELVSLLKESGLFLGRFENTGYHVYLQQLIAGEQPFKGKKAIYSLVELNQLFEKIKDKISFKIVGIKNDVNTSSRAFINQIAALCGEGTRANLESPAFLVKVQKINPSLQDLFKAIEKKDSIEEELSLLNDLDTEQVIHYILENIGDPSEILQKLAINNFYLGQHEHVLPYLQAAIEYDASNRDTLYNIGFILNEYGEKNLALKYLTPFKGKDEKINELYQGISGENLNKTRELTFLMRRIEFDVDAEEARQQLSEKLSNGYFEENEIYEVLAVAIYDKIKVLQTIAITSFENGGYDHVLPFLNEAYKMDKGNKDILYNLAYVLAAYGEKEVAQSYLKMIPEQDRAPYVAELFQLIQGENVYE